MKRRSFSILGGCLAAAALASTALAGAASADGKQLRFDLTPSSAAIASCLPHAKAEVKVNLTTEEDGFDRFSIKASGLVPNQSYTVFLLEQPGNPFGAAEYIGDFSADRYGNGRGRFRLIVEEAFSSTLVGKDRVRAELNHVGFWFADPTADDQCIDGGGPVTPFDGDNEAGVQVMNSAKALPGAPLP
jgi:hypothetical protein